MQLQGYDTGVISGALVTIGKDLGGSTLTNGQKVRALAVCPHSPTEYAPTRNS